MIKFELLEQPDFDFEDFLDTFEKPRVEKKFTLSSLNLKNKKSDRKMQVVKSEDPKAQLKMSRSII